MHKTDVAVLEEKNIGIKIPTEKHKPSKTYHITCAKSEVIRIDVSILSYGAS
jgi:hypothetical protein